MLINFVITSVGSINDDWINELTKENVLPEQTNGLSDNETLALTKKTYDTNFGHTESSTRLNFITSSLPPTQAIERIHSRFRSDQNICLNVTAITRAVHQSEVVFAGKILKLYEQMPAVPSSHDMLVESHRNSLDYSAKRRRESYFVGDTFRRIKATPYRPTQQLKPFPRYEAQVLVKTIFKGASKSIEDTKVTVFVDPNELVKQASRGMARCVRKLRALDTRLFFYSSIENGYGVSNDFMNRSNRLVSSSFASNLKQKSANEAGGNISLESSSAVFRASSQTFWPVPPTLLVLDAIRTAVRGK